MKRKVNPDALRGSGLRLKRRRNPKFKIKERYFLCLDPGAEEGRIRFFILDEAGEAVVAHEFDKDQKTIEKVTAALEGKLKSKKLVLHNLAGIAVVKGGESFSAVRGIHAIANALGWSMGVPVARVHEAWRHEGTKKMIEILRRRKKFQLLIPEYSREPNITVKNPG